jgi:hypothetical protein
MVNCEIQLILTKSIQLDPKDLMATKYWAQSGGLSTSRIRFGRFKEAMKKLSVRGRAWSRGSSTPSRDRIDQAKRSWASI